MEVFVIGLGDAQKGQASEYFSDMLAVFVTAPIGRGGTMGAAFSLPNSLQCGFEGLPAFATAYCPDDTVSLDSPICGGNTLKAVDHFSCVLLFCTLSGSSLLYF